jgi:hypothetical protein
VHQGIGGYDDIAARLALKNPNWPKDMIKAILMEGHAEIAKMLNEGMQVTLENAFTFRPSLHARLDAPDDQLPPIDKLLEVTVSASQPFIKAVRQNARLERLPPGEKAPVILATEDTVLELNDVLDSAGALRISGNNLAFEKGALGCGCLIEGTRSGSAVQPQLVRRLNRLMSGSLPAQVVGQNDCVFRQCSILVQTAFPLVFLPCRNTQQRARKSSSQTPVVMCYPALVARQSAI